MKLLIIFIIVLFLYVIMKKKKPKPRIIFTMTTFFQKQERFRNFKSFMDSFHFFHNGHQVSDFCADTVIINEWGGDYDYTNYFKTNFPRIFFIQKQKHDQGQPRSLNILINKFLRNGQYDYWVHWEDSWVLVRPIFPDIVRIMQKNPNIIQLQLTNDWEDIPPSRKIQGYKCYTLVPHPETNLFRNVYEEPYLDLSRWPLFSLRPSINRLDFFQKNNHIFHFDEDPRLWPIWFEWEFARYFLMNHGVKAISSTYYTKRLPFHIHSYE